MDIVHMWQCIWIEDGDSGNINSPCSILMQCHSISENLIFPSLNSVSDISYDLWSGRCNNIASLSHMQYHSMWEIFIFPSPNSVPAICKIFEVGNVITLPDSPFFIWRHCHIMWTMSIFPMIFGVGNVITLHLPAICSTTSCEKCPYFHLQIQFPLFVRFLQWAM